LQLTFCPHEESPPHPMVHVLAVQLMPQSHELVPGQLTVHAVPPQEIGPHALVPEHVRSQLEASEQSMPCPHEERPPQTTLHATPFGHFTFAGQGVMPNVQSITHTLPWQVPIPLHASAHDGGCASGPASLGFGPESGATPSTAGPLSATSPSSLTPGPASLKRSLAGAPPHATNPAASQIEVIATMLRAAMVKGRMDGF
jgi:hypothetical protein